MAKYRFLETFSYEPREVEYRGKWRSWSVGDVMTYPDPVNIPTALDIEFLKTNGIIEEVV